MSFMKHIKKIFVLVFAVFAVSVASINNANADSSLWDLYLRTIAENTTQILLKVNDIPTYLQNLVQLVGELKINLLSNDDTDHTAQLQQQFALIGSLIAQSSDQQNINQLQMTSDILGLDRSFGKGQDKSSMLILPKEQPEILKYLPSVNDLIYSTVIGKPLVPHAPADAKNYIKYVSGAGIYHVMPNSTWQGGTDSLFRYMNYFNTVTSVESYNGYQLTKQMSPNNSLTAAQMSLVQLASNSDWMATIATEEIGKVLRQLLMFNSQTYVLLTRFMQGQQDLLTAQLMTNTLLINNNVQYEAVLLASAQGVPVKI